MKTSQQRHVQGRMASLLNATNHAQELTQNSQILPRRERAATLLSLFYEASITTAKEAIT